MQIETIGHYQIHLFAVELSGTDKWDPFFSILRFDDAADDFVCVEERQHVDGEPAPDYETAIDRARRAANAVLEKHAM